MSESYFLRENDLFFVPRDTVDSGFLRVSPLSLNKKKGHKRSLYSTDTTPRSNMVKILNKEVGRVGFGLMGKREKKNRKQATLNRSRGLCLFNLSLNRIIISFHWHLHCNLHLSSLANMHAVI